MAKQRYINTKLWSDSWVSELDPIEKLLFLYILTNERTNICGIYELPLKLMAVETGIEKEMLIKIFNRFEKEGKVIFRNGWVKIINFIKHQDVGSETIKKGIELALKSIPPHILDTLSIPYPYPANNFNNNNNNNSNPSDEVANTEIVSLIDSFKEINPAYQDWFRNKTQRKSAEWLVKEFGLDVCLKMIAFLPKLNKMTYAPTTTTPYELKNNMAKIKSFMEKEKSKIINKGKGLEQ